jgi:hypothetical protein
VLERNKSLLKQQDLSTQDLILCKKVLEQKNKEYSLEIKKYQEINQELEKKITTLTKNFNERIVIPSPTPPVIVEVKKKKKSRSAGMDGSNEVQLMADALLRIQESMKGVTENEEEIMDDLADELLERVQIKDEISEGEEEEM